MLRFSTRLLVLYLFSGVLAVQARACFMVTPEIMPSAAVHIRFEDHEEDAFTRENQRLIREIIMQAEREVRALLPALPGNIEVTVKLIDRELDSVGGVTGRADAPGVVIIEMSKAFPGGLEAAAKTGLPKAVFHEFHHLVRGWTIRGNRFGPGMSIAVVNEGLADVFAEQYTGLAFEADAYPEEVDQWVAEVLALPPDADYNHWMNKHPDGRLAIGYKTGRYIIHQAMIKSGKTVLELSELSPEEVLALAEVQ